MILSIFKNLFREGQCHLQCQNYTWVLAEVLIVLIPVKLPAGAPRKAAEEGPGAWAPATHLEVVGKGLGSWPSPAQPKPLGPLRKRARGWRCLWNSVFEINKLFCTKYLLCNKYPKDPDLDSFLQVAQPLSSRYLASFLGCLTSWSSFLLSSSDSAAPSSLNFVQFQAHTTHFPWESKALLYGCFVQAAGYLT